MPRNRAVQASLAAVLAAGLVLGPAPGAATKRATSGATSGAAPVLATASPDGFSGLLLDRPRCCLPDATRERMARGVDGPAAGDGPGGRASSQGPVLAQSSEAPAPRPEQRTPPDQRPPATELPRDAERMPETPATEAGEAFKGSPKPAGPDLTVNEERELISRGWE